MYRPPWRVAEQLTRKENEVGQVVHFEINADDPERLKTFYGDVFGWVSHKTPGPNDYWLLMTGEGEGINGAMMRREQSVLPATRLVNTVSVSSVDDVIARVTNAGGTVAFPKTAIPGVGHIAYCLDIEGNAFGILQRDPGAGG